MTPIQQPLHHLHSTDHDSRDHRGNGSATHAALLRDRRLSRPAPPRPAGLEPSRIGMQFRRCLAYVVGVGQCDAVTHRRDAAGRPLCGRHGGGCMCCMTAEDGGDAADVGHPGDSLPDDFNARR